jgi:hypothetical protein
MTFVLLLGAIILWMVPNQRQSMLRVSPFLIVYAEFLLITQFVSGVDILAGELPSIKIPIPLELIGFEHVVYAFKPLAIKVSSLTFATTPTVCLQSILLRKQTDGNFAQFYALSLYVIKIKFYRLTNFLLIICPDIVHDHVLDHDETVHERKTRV